MNDERTASVRADSGDWIIGIALVTASMFVIFILMLCVGLAPASAAPVEGTVITVRGQPGLDAGVIPKH